MPMPLPPDSETQVPPPHPQQQKLPPLIRRRRKKFVSKKLVIFVGLTILGLGCANLVSILALWRSIQSEETANRQEIRNYKPNDLSVRITQPDFVRDVTETPLIAEVLPLRNVPTPILFSLPEPTATLKPTSIPTPVIIDDIRPPPRPLPISPSLPTAIAPSPTATSLPIATLTPTLTATLQSEITHVLIITIDGLRPDALFLANTPTLDELIAEGAYCPNAKTIIPSFTLPAHVSMLNGVLPQKHGIVEALPCIGCRLSIGPTLFSVAHDAGLSTAMVFGKEKLDYLILPHSVDEFFGADDIHDSEIEKHAIEFIQAGLPNVLFIHFPDTDRVGHVYGWMSDNQIQSITFVDGLIGEIEATLESGSYLNSTLQIITADHGGHGFNHGDDSPIDRTIPWLAVGPGVPPGVTITADINIYDTAATALYALKLPIPERWDGQPILEIFEPSP